MMMLMIEDKTCSGLVWSAFTSYLLKAPIDTKSHPIPPQEPRYPNEMR